MSKLYVGNLSYGTTEEDLWKFVTQKGFEVEEATVIQNHDTNRSRGFGFLTLKSADQLQPAIEKCNGALLDGRRLAVSVARPKTAKA